MKFAARIDAWAVCLIAMGALAAIGVGIFFIYIAGGELVGVAGGIVMVLVGVAMFSSLVLSGYEITSSHVVRWPLPLRLIRIDEIAEAAPVNSIYDLACCLVFTRDPYHWQQEVLRSPSTHRVDLAPGQNRFPTSAC